MRKFLKLFAALFAFAMCVAISAEARSITGVSRYFSEGKMYLDVALEKGQSGDTHALYIAYDMEDKGGDISSWAALQRGCVVAADATSVTIPISPLLAEKGYVFCRVFLTTSKVPYDTLIEFLRQSGSQYIDTGIYPSSTSVAVMDVKIDSKEPAQQRLFGVSSDKDGGDHAKFSFDCYINGSFKFATACKDGVGDWKTTDAFTTDRVLVSLSAVDNHRTVIQNLTTGAKIADKSHNATCTKTSTATLLLFAQHYVKSSGAGIPSAKIAKGANLYSFSMTNNAECVCDYKPCRLGDRVGVYDSVTKGIVYSASGTDFDAANSGSPVVCSLLDGEEQIAAAPAATGLFSDYTWIGTLQNWGDANAWTKDGTTTPTIWADGNNAIFATANSTATLVADVMANSVVFNADTTIATNGTDEAVLAVKSVAVDAGVSATISASTSGALEKTGAGALTLTESRADATIVTEGTLKMNGANVSGLTLGTDGGAPITFDYGGQELQKNPQDYLVTGSTVTLTNGVFSTAENYDLNLRDDLSTQVFPSVLTIAKDALFTKTTTSKSVYICKGGSGSSTINIVGGSFAIDGGTSASYIQHKSEVGRVNINVSDGGFMRFPDVVYALCRGDINITSPSLYMVFSDSVFSVGGAFQFGSSFSDANADKAAVTPTGVFAATNSIISIGTGFWVGRNVIDEKVGGSFSVDFEDCIVTAKNFAVYYDRSLNNARFNDTRFVFNADGGDIRASDGESKWITVGEDGLILDTQEYSATLNANLGGSGAVTKVGEGMLTVSRNQATIGGFNIGEGTLTINGDVTFAGPAEFAAGTTLNIAAYNGTASIKASKLTLPSEVGTVALTLNGGSFAKGVYEICSASGVTAADGSKFAFATVADDLRGSWSVVDGTLLLTVGEVSGNYWTGRGGDCKMSTAANWVNGVPEAGADIDLSFISSATTIIVDPGMAFGAVTMGTGVVTFSGEMVATSFTDTSKVAVGENSSVAIDNDITITDAAQKLCNSVAAGGKLYITGKLEISHSSDTFSFLSASWGAGAVVVEGGISVNTTATTTMNAKALVLGASGLTFSQNGVFRFKAQGSGDKEKPVIYSLGASTVIGSGSTGKQGILRGDYAPFTFCTTQFESDQPATITFDSNIDGDTGWNAQWAVNGCGRLVCVATSRVDRGLTVKVGAVCALMPGIGTFGQKDQDFYVNSGAILEVAASGTAKIIGETFTIADGAVLGFNFTERKTAPVFAPGSTKPAMTVGGSVAVKVSGSVWPVSGEYQLTTCGGFGVEGVSVSLSPDSAAWAKMVEVKDGNIFLTVKPKPSMVIIR